MISQQRNSYPAGRQSNKPTTTATPTTSSASIRLPPALTSDALSSLSRLPIRNDSVLNWERYDCGTSTENKGDSRATFEALLQLEHSESRAFGGDIAGSSSSVLTHTLWAVEQDNLKLMENNEQIPTTPAISCFWIFDLQSQETMAESSRAASSDERRQASRCKEVVKRRLSSSEFKKEVGRCSLQDFYKPFGSTLHNDTLSLTAVSDYNRCLQQFSRALRGHFLGRWIWSNPQQGPLEEGQLAKASSRHVTENQTRGVGINSDKEKDEEEEGAIDDATVLPLPSLDKYGLEYWPKTLRAQKKRPIRFGEGIVLEPPPRRSNSLFSQNSPHDRQALYMTLRCFLDDQGYIYVETRPGLANGMEHIDTDDINNCEGLLAPTAFSAVLVERVRGLHWSNKSEIPSDKETERQVVEWKQRLLKMLEVRGIDLEDLGDDWMICETKEKSRFLWPTKLCFALPPKKDQVSDRVDLPGMKLAIKPLRDIAERAKGLVRESIGSRIVVEDEDAIMYDSDGTSDEADNADEEDFSDEESEEMEEENSQEDKQENVQDLEILPKETVAQETNREGSIRAYQAEEDKPIGSIKEDDETDLWGSFGFGTHDDEGKNSTRRQSIAGLDEGGFGLITEDDFSFFDEAARAVGTFDGMDVDLGQQDTLDEKGDLTVQSGDMDTSSDNAMTSSTFVDPPSLPGFTPSSLSATSPAVGGLNAKTPRTPFSPSQDLVDAQVAIEGEGDSMFSDSHRFQHHHHHEVTLDQLPSDYTEAGQDEANKSTREEGQGWTPQSRGDLMTKYEQGKFALPLAPSRKKGEAEEGSEEGRNEGESTVFPRSRLRHRLHQGRRLDSGRSLQIRKLKMGALSLRGEEESSDLDATIDGTISDQSSLVDEDSDEEMASASDETSEEEEFILKERLELLQSSVEALEVFWSASHRNKVTKSSNNEEEVDLVKDAEIRRSLKRLTMNPLVRVCVCSPRPEISDKCVRSVTQELFTPLPMEAEQNRLAVLLSLDPKPGLNLPIQTLDAPKIMIGCQGAIASMEPTALSFWEKLGLSAVSGPKEVAALALYCGCLPSSWQKELLDWFSAFNDMFKRTGLGNQSLTDDALLALGESHTTSISQILAQTSRHQEQWTDTLDSLLSRMHSNLSMGKFVVIYCIGVQTQPSCLWVLSKLESDLQDLAKSRWGTVPDLINVRGMSWTTVSTSMRALAGDSFMRRLALSVYDALDVPIQPLFNRKSHLPVIQSDSVGVVHPSFTLSPVNHLARSSTPFQLQWKADPFNLNDTGLLLHVAYHIAPTPGQLSFVAIMDERAQGYFVNGWRRIGKLQTELELVWKEVQSYASRARLLWRIIICKESKMQLEEVQIWSSILNKVPPSLRALDITLTCIDTLTPMTLILPRRNQTEATELAAKSVQKQAKDVEDKTSHYIDAKQVDYVVYPPFRMPICQEPDEDRDEIMLPLLSSTIVSFSNQYNGSVAATSSSIDTTWSQTSSRHFWIHLLQVYDTIYSSDKERVALQRRIDIITRSFHHLMFIAKERFYLVDNLPWHISILATACRAHVMF